MTDTVIGQGSRISLHFSLQLEDGCEVDSTKEPASLTVGDGNLPVGFEETLFGLRAGDEKSSTILPEKAFGMPNTNNVQSVPRKQFGEGMNLEEGLVVSFADAANAELPGVIRSFDEERVEVDFNHPLAGRTLVFNVQIISVESALD